MKFIKLLLILLPVASFAQDKNAEMKKDLKSEVSVEQKNKNRAAKIEQAKAVEAQQKAQKAKEVREEEQRQSNQIRKTVSK